MEKKSSEGVDLKGKTVVLRDDCYVGDETARTFKCEDGFGCSPSAIGRAVFGHFIADGEKARISRDEIAFVLES